LKVSIKKLDKAIETESGKLKGFESLVRDERNWEFIGRDFVVGDRRNQRLCDIRQIGKLFEGWT